MGNGILQGRLLPGYRGSGWENHDLESPWLSNPYDFDFFTIFNSSEDLFLCFCVFMFFLSTGAPLPKDSTTSKPSDQTTSTNEEEGGGGENNVVTKNN